MSVVALPGPMGLLLLAWGLLGACLTGVGLLFLRLCSPKPAVTPSPQWLWGAFWFGFWAAIAVLQLWHLFLPVNGLVLAGLGAAGCLGLWLDRRELARCCVALRSRHRGALLGAAVLALWCANRAMGPPVGDSGLYHLNMIRWFNAYPVVPGLGNLHDRLGFNNPSLLWSALLEVGFWVGRSSHVALGLPLLTLALAVYAGAVQCWRARPADRLEEHFFLAVLASPLVGHLVTLQELRISGPDPDTAAALALFVGCVGLTRLACSARRSGQADADGRADLLLAVLLFELAVCFKLSMLGFAVPAIAAALWLGRRRPEGAGPSALPWVPLVVCSVVLVVPWLIRGWVLTGYPLYPSTLFPLGCDWRVPLAAVDHTRAAIQESFAPPLVWQEVRGGRSPLSAWLFWQATRCPELVLVPALLLWAAGARLFLKKGGPGAVGSRVLWSVLIPGAGGLLLWGLTAPAPRFAYPIFWSAAAAATAVAFAPALNSPRRPPRAAFLAAWLLVALLPLGHRLVAWRVAGSPERVVATLVMLPGPDFGFHPAPVAVLRPRKTDSGLPVLVPVGDDKVWGGPLVATPDFNPRLRLRRPGDVSAGFTVNP